MLALKVKAVEVHIRLYTHTQSQTHTNTHTSIDKNWVRGTYVTSLSKCDKLPLNTYLSASSGLTPASET